MRFQQVLVTLIGIAVTIGFNTPLVDGQLEAVSAVLSVVPVTSILATAGLVGVKLAAISRILQMLGYDRAYLASGGAGTAAQPIGLQQNYAYMFPYVPGVNVSVKGEHGPYQGGHAAMPSASTPYVTDRKTYPSMMLPGEFERFKQFRGVDLAGVLRKAGIVVPDRPQQAANSGSKGGPNISPAQQKRLEQQLLHDQDFLKAISTIQRQQRSGSAAQLKQQQSAATKRTVNRNQQSKLETDKQQRAAGQSTSESTGMTNEARAISANKRQEGTGSFGMPASNIDRLRRRRRKRSVGITPDGSTHTNGLQTILIKPGERSTKSYIDQRQYLNNGSNRRFKRVMSSYAESHLSRQQINNEKSSLGDNSLDGRINSSNDNIGHNIDKYKRIHHTKQRPMSKLLLAYVPPQTNAKQDSDIVPSTQLEGAAPKSVVESNFIMRPALKRYDNDQSIRRMSNLILFV